MEITPLQVDNNAWPSSYNRKAKRVDLEKFYLQIQQESEQLEQEQKAIHSKPKKQVRFSTEPPIVFTYEPEYDLFERLKSSIEQSKDSWPTYARKPRKLDLRPIVNNQYCGQSPTQLNSAPCFSTSSSPSLLNNNNNNNHTPHSLPNSPIINPLPSSFNKQMNHINRSSSTSSIRKEKKSSHSPPSSPNLPHLSTSDDSSDDDDQPSPTLALTPTNSSLPFSSNSFTKRISAVFSRKKRSST
ncbi:unnamed protein product [Cunninghamella blakesleeana]